MEELWRDPRVVDGVLALVAVEFAVLTIWLGRRRDRRWPALAATLLSGAFLLIALRLSLAGASGTWLAAALLAALVAHLADLACRLRRAS